MCHFGKSFWPEQMRIDVYSDNRGLIPATKVRGHIQDSQREKWTGMFWGPSRSYAQSGQPKQAWTESYWVHEDDPQKLFWVQNADAESEERGQGVRGLAAEFIKNNTARPSSKTLNSKIPYSTSGQC